jgi:hypothetical protein
MNLPPQSKIARVNDILRRWIDIFPEDLLNNNEAVNMISELISFLTLVDFSAAENLKSMLHSVCIEISFV